MLCVTWKLKMTKKFESLLGKVRGFTLNLVSLGGCFATCCDHTQVCGLGTKILNLSDSPVELQIRVGSILKKVHTLKPGCSKRVKSKCIYKAYMPEKSVSSSSSGGKGLKSLLYYYDETCQPYIWIQDIRGGSLRMVKQQYISLEDLKDSSEIRILRDSQKGCISVCKRTRPSSA